MKVRDELFCEAWNKWIATERGKAMVGHADDGLTGKPFLNVVLGTFRAGYEAGRTHAALGRGGRGRAGRLPRSPGLERAGGCAG